MQPVINTLLFLSLGNKLDRLNCWKLKQICAKLLLFLGMTSSNRSQAGWLKPEHRVQSGACSQSDDLCTHQTRSNIDYYCYTDCHRSSPPMEKHIGGETKTRRTRGLLLASGNLKPSDADGRSNRSRVSSSPRR
jgi:hypothetical protein